MKNRSTVMVAISLSVCGGAMFWSGCSATARSNNFPDLGPQDTNPRLYDHSSERTFSDHGVDFTYDSELFTKVTVEEKAESMLTTTPILPDSVEPRQLDFNLTGPGVRYTRQGDFPAQIQVFATSDYQRSMRRVPDYSVTHAKKMEGLKRAITDCESREAECMYPFVPSVPSTQAIHAHHEIIPFQNGKGVGYITQFTMDVDLINNEKLLYVFQGITEDGKYFVSATFPIQTNMLPGSRDATSYKNYTQPEDFYSIEHRDENLKAYQTYLTGVENDLEATKDNDFMPDLNAIRGILQSLRVKPSY